MPAAMAGHRPLFILGSPRSGTTWLQLLLAQHPRVATTQETHLFGRYLSPLDERWKFDAGRGDDQRRVGLPTVLPRDELHGFFRQLTERVLHAAVRAKPDADTVVYKGDNEHGELMLEVMPDAHFLHLIRDPRAVTCSIRAASATFGSRWAPKGIQDAAGLWARSVRASRAVADRTQRYTEVRYEALSADTPAELERIFAWLDLPADRATCEAAAEACAFDRLKKGGEGSKTPWDVGKEPKGFFRKGQPDAWREELTPLELDVLEFTVADLMRELGYGFEGPSAGDKPSALTWRERRRRVANALRKVSSFAASRIEGPRI